MKGRTKDKFCTFEIIYYESGTAMHCSLGTADPDNIYIYIPRHLAITHIVINITSLHKVQLYIFLDFSRQWLTYISWF